MDIDSYAELCKANRVLQADLSAAQDEIERLISEKEALREALDQAVTYVDEYSSGMDGFGLTAGMKQVIRAALGGAS